MNVRSLSVIFATIVAAVLAMVAPKAATAAVGTQVVNGAEVSRSRFDEVWRPIVSVRSSEFELFRRGGDRARHSCGGVLVEPDIVLTAAHCVRASASAGSSTIEVGQYTVLFGARRLGAGKVSYGASYRVQQVVSHPSYANSPFSDAPRGFDIAVLKLAKPVEGAVTMRIAGSADDAVWGAGTGKSSGNWIAGWGRTVGYSWSSDESDARSTRDLVHALERSVTSPEKDAEPAVLREAELPLIPDRRCASTDSPLGEEARYFDRMTMICVGTHDTKRGPGTSGASACYGDSGGPLVTTTSSNDVILIGIASWVASEACEGFSVYTRVPALRGWIDDTIAGIRAGAPVDITGLVSSRVTGHRMLRVSWAPALGRYKRILVTSEESLYDRYRREGYRDAFPPFFERYLKRTTIRTIIATAGEGSRSVTVRGMRPQKRGDNALKVRLVAELDDGRRVFGPRYVLAGEVDSRPPSRPGVPRIRGTFAGAPLARFAGSRDNDCVRSLVLEVRPSGTRGSWKYHSDDNPVDCPGSSSDDDWYELSATTRPLFDLRPGNWLVRVVAVDDAGNRSAGRPARIHISKLVEDLGLDPECRVRGENVVCVYPKDEF